MTFSLLILILYFQFFPFFSFCAIIQTVDIALKWLNGETCIQLPLSLNLSGFLRVFRC